MDFVTTKENLLRELQSMQGIVEKKSTMPILSNILIDAKKDRLDLLATDLEVGVRSTCEATVSKPGSVTLRARKLFDIVRLLPDADVRLKEEDGHWVVITCQKSRFRIVGLPREDFPVIPEFDFSKGIPLEKALLLDMINKVLFAVSTDETRVDISGALMIIDKKHLTLVATDGHRLAHVSGRLEAGSSDSKIDLMLPRKAVQELSRIGENEKEILFGHKDNYAFFKCGRSVLSTILVAGKFPDFVNLLEGGSERVLRLESGLFADALRRVALLSNERTRAVKFALSKGAIEISSSDPEVGEAVESLDIDYPGPEMEIGFNAKYLLDFMQAMGPGALTLALKDDQAPGLMKPVGKEGRDYRYVIMPMRI